MNGSTLELLVTILLLTVIACVIASWLHALRQPGTRRGTEFDLDTDTPRFGAGSDDQLGKIPIPAVNPATGLPMMSTLHDVAGNPWGSASPNDSGDEIGVRGFD
jgi:hypothetical protein